MSARDDISPTFAARSASTATEKIRRQMVADRLERAPKGVIPQRGQVSGEERLALFRVQVEASLATVTK